MRPLLVLQYIHNYTSNTLAEQYNIYPAKNIQNMMESLLDNIPGYNWKPLNWFSSSEDDNVLQDTNMKLDDILQLIVEETEQEIYKDTAEFEKAKHNLKHFSTKLKCGKIFQ